MNQLESNDVTKCYICDVQISINFKNVQHQVSRYTGTPVGNILSKFVDDDLKKRRPDQCTILCQCCLDKIDEYDLAIVTAERVESELIQLFVSTLNKYESISLETSEVSTLEAENELNDLNTELENIIDQTNHQIDLPQMNDNNDYDNTLHMDAKGSTPKSKEHQIQTDDNDDDKDDKDNDNIFYNKTSESKNKINAEELQISLRKSTKIISSRPLYYCDKCTCKFSNKLDLKSHLKKHEPNEKQICDICGQTYKSKAALDIHVGLHKGKSPHECELCGKHFTQKGALVRHMPLHTGEKPYQCDKCGKQFVHYSSFHMHQLAHDNIREKKCTVCGMELRSNSHLTRHMRVHSGEKPYSCPTCGQKFAQRYNMMTHFKAHQGIHRVNSKSHVCPICYAGFPKALKLNEHMSHQHNVTTETFEDKRNIIQDSVQQSSQMILNTNQSTVHIDSHLTDAGHLVSLDGKHIENGRPSVCLTIPVSTINIPISSFLLQNTELLQIKKENFMENV